MEWFARVAIELRAELLQGRSVRSPATHSPASKPHAHAVNSQRRPVTWRRAAGAFPTGLPSAFATTSLDCYMFEIVLLRVSDGSLRVVYRTDYGELYGIDWK